MDELRPAAEVVEDIVRAQGMAPKAAVLQADRITTVEVCVDVVDSFHGNTAQEQRAAIRAVAKPPETEREQLGRVVREEGVRWAGEQENSKPSWLIPREILPEDQREVDCRIAAAVRAELDKIRGEADE